MAQAGKTVLDYGVFYDGDFHGANHSRNLLGGETFPWNLPRLTPGFPGKGGTPTGKVGKKLCDNDESMRAEVLMRRIAHFTRRVMFGSREFVDEMFVAMKDRLGPGKRGGARRMRGVKEPLFSLRNLRVNLVGQS